MPIKRGAIFFILPLFLLLLAASDPMGQNGNAGAVSSDIASAKEITTKAQGTRKANEEKKNAGPGGITMDANGNMK